MTKEIAIHNLFALKLRSRVTSDREALDMAIKALEQTSWISVSELPKEDGKYLVSRKNEENIWVEEAYYSTTSRTTFPKGFSIIKDNFSWRINNVIAWMSLPQPYSESEGEE